MKIGLVKAGASDYDEINNMIGKSTQQRSQNRVITARTTRSTH
jgi:hypothetical protein